MSAFEICALVLGIAAVANMAIANIQRYRTNETLYMIARILEAS